MSGQEWQNDDGQRDKRAEPRFLIPRDGGRGRRRDLGEQRNHRMHEGHGGKQSYMLSGVRGTSVRESLFKSDRIAYSDLYLRYFLSASGSAASTRAIELNVTSIFVFVASSILSVTRSASGCTLATMP